MNFDKTVLYDERPGFESYSMMNMYPMVPNIGFIPNNMNSFNNLESRISTLEKKVSNLEKTIQNNIYPSATDYSSYQNSMNIM